MDGMHGGMMMNGTGSMNSSSTVHKKRMMMHMAFYWGNTAEVLFTGWPGTRPGMYYLAIIFIFFLAIIVEWLSHSSFLTRSNSSDRVRVGLAQTVLYGLRSGLSYMIMLSVMSFNVGVFLAAVVGHTIGFFFFGSRVFKGNRDDSYVMSSPRKTTTNLPPMNC
ncbi:copper transporter 6-like [Impatiens glandulifera]|uniref:copper transporter 6-like n=1 Tax=Impatiens glandulifera TaxID=253017 RepID=UPI001FB0A687|nr:copper transporter 6-like [Impatiens glandulifera]